MLGLLSDEEEHLRRLWNEGMEFDDYTIRITLALEKCIACDCVFCCPSPSTLPPSSYPPISVYPSIGLGAIFATLPFAVDVRYWGIKHPSMHMWPLTLSPTIETQRTGIPKKKYYRVCDVLGGRISQSIFLAGIWCTALNLPFANIYVPVFFIVIGFPCI